MVTTVGPQDVLDAVRVARGALSSVAEPSGVRGSREEWAAVAGELQSPGERGDGGAGRGGGAVGGGRAAVV